MGFKTRTKNGEGWSRGDMRWKTVPQDERPSLNSKLSKKYD